MEKETRKSDIIKMALLELGFPFSEADNKEAEEVKAASFLFDTALETVFIEDGFDFNIKIVEPKLTERGNIRNKYEYVKPQDHICSITPGIQGVGDRLLCDKYLVTLKYKARVDIQDIPPFYNRYISLVLAELLSSTANKQKALPRIEELMAKEKRKIIETESHDVKIGDLI